jgi:hypothetical protein
MLWRVEEVAAVATVASLNSDDEYREDRQQGDGDKPYTREYQHWC